MKRLPQRHKTVLAIATCGIAAVVCAQADFFTMREIKVKHHISEDGVDYSNSEWTYLPLVSFSESGSLSTPSGMSSWGLVFDDHADGIRLDGSTQLNSESSHGGETTFYAYFTIDTWAYYQFSGNGIWGGTGDGQGFRDGAGLYRAYDSGSGFFIHYSPGIYQEYEAGYGTSVQNSIDGVMEYPTDPPLGYGSILRGENTGYLAPDTYLAIFGFGLHPSTAAIQPEIWGASSYEFSLTATDSPISAVPESDDMVWVFGCMVALMFGVEQLRKMRRAVR